MPELVYLNFDLEIEKADGGYRAHVLSSPAGEARTPLGPVDHLPTEAAPPVLGGALFDAVFRGDVLSSLRRSLDAAQRSERGLRIRLRLSETPELADLPWELLYDGQRASFLALSRETPLVRYLDLPEPAESATPEIRLRVLAVIASPSDFPALDVEQEWNSLKQGMADLEARGVVTLDRLDPPTVDALQKQLLKHEYHILHFLGHGDYSPDDGDSLLVMAAADGRGEAVSGETFATLLSDQRSLRLAVISVCRGAVSGAHDPYSGVAQRLVRGGVPAVIAMRSAISAAAAEALARSFYTTLAVGAAVDEAMAEARKTLYSGGFPNEWATAVLYMRAADGHLWRPDPAARQKRLRIALAAAAAVVVLGLFAAFLVYNSWPTKMDPNNTIDVAVLDAGVLQGNSYVASPDSKLIRSWMVAELDKTSQISSTASIGVWHNDLGRREKRNPLPVLAPTSESDRERDARLLAGRILANVVISARITDAGDGQRTLTPEFYVLPELAPTAGEAIGYYTLGDPIRYTGDLSTNSGSRAAVRDEVTRRVRILNSILVALQYDSLGEHGRALDTLQALQAGLGLPATGADAQPVSRPAADQAGSGLDDVYYFLAREKLFVGDGEGALADVNRALQIDPKNLRAQIVLGSTLVDRGLAQEPLVAVEPGGLLDQAAAEYEKAVQQALAASGGAGSESLVGSIQYPIARVGKGDALVAHAEVLCQLYSRSPAEQTAADAWRYLADADATLDASILVALQKAELWRMAAQYHAIVGSGRLCRGRLAALHGDIDGARTLYKEAETAFGKCTEPGAKMPADKTLQRIASGCTAARDRAERALARLG